MRKPRLTESPELERHARRRLAELRTAERNGRADDILEELEEDSFDFRSEEVDKDALALAVAIAEARCRRSGPWADATFEARGNTVGIWLARIRTVGGEALTVRRAYARWLADIEQGCGDRRSEMLSRLAFWVVVANTETDDEGERIARRALDLATTPLDQARALTEMGHALIFVPKRRKEAEASLAEAMSRVQDGPTRWQAQYHHAYLAHVDGKMKVAVERYLSLFRSMVVVPGAIETDLGWTVAVDLLGFMREAKDRRVEDVQRTYDAARDRDGLGMVEAVAARKRRGPA